ncbi:hypothetical protein VB773_05030 [Haloarculaceae archaeon H-GB2-1]|nr:hypothetical protein [Haloarculaceae archaeon H-GB2-1]
MYLIGGEALTLRNLKNATKDVDLIVENTEELERLRRSLRNAGFQPPENLQKEYEELDAAFILEKGIRRFDVFRRQVAGELVLSEPMKERSQHLFDEGLLTVRMVSANDIFLFKSVANRDDDVDDMVVLVQAGIDEAIIMDEARRQIGEIGQDAFVRSMKQKMTRLKADGYSFDIHDDVSTLYTELEKAETVEQTVWNLYDTEYRDDLYDGVPRSRLERQLPEEVDVDEALEWLRRVDRLQTAPDGSLVPL